MTDWTFQDFGSQFDDHALAHLPEYRRAHETIAHAASFALRPGGLLVDLGASTGYAVESISNALAQRPFDAMLYDLDDSMLEQARTRLDPIENVRAEFHQLDLVLDGMPHQDADVTLLLWTLQFLPPHSWPAVLSCARNLAAPDGLLLVGAKTRLSDSRWQEQADAATSDWKATHGVTPQEALDKSRSLRGTMLVVSLDRLYRELETAGWHAPAVLFRWYSWVIVGAWATPLSER